MNNYNQMADSTNDRQPNKEVFEMPFPKVLGTTESGKRVSEIRPDAMHACSPAMPKVTLQWVLTIYIPEGGRQNFHTF